MHIDEETGTITLEGGQKIDLHSKEAFERLSRLWLRVGWDQKYIYTFSWLGRPVIQLPDDLIRVQEVIWNLRPDVIIETGVAHGGSLVFYATLCKILGKGRVIGVDIEIRPHNRQAIERHPLASYISLVEGDSVAPSTVEKVKEMVTGAEKVLVLLDSNHSREHVLKELKAYAPLVAVGSYIVACDGIMRDVVGSARARPQWKTDNPAEAAREFCAQEADFEIKTPTWPFNESGLSSPVTHWPDAWIRRKR